MYRFWEPEEHAKCTRYSAVWQCSGNVPHNFVPEHVPVPEHASPSNNNTTMTMDDNLATARDEQHPTLTDALQSLTAIS
jgi:hypothetical protein